MSDPIPPDKEDNKRKLADFLKTVALDVESLNQRFNSLQTQIESLPTTIQNIVIQTIQSLQNHAEPTQNTLQSSAISGPTSIILDEKKAEIITKAIDKVLDRFLGNPAQAQTGIIDDSWLKEQLGQTVKEQIMLGHEVTQAVRRTLTGAKAKNAMLSVIDKHEVE